MRNPDRIPASRPGDLRTSIHEAAHAVIAISRGLPIDRVELRQDTYQRGALYCPPVAVAMRSLDVIVTDLAGGEGERYAFGYIDGGGDRADVAMARAELARILSVGPSDAVVDEMLECCRSETEGSVKKHWLWILDVAALLRRERVLYTAAIERLRPHVLSGDQPGTMPPTATTETDHEQRPEGMAAQKGPV